MREAPAVRMRTLLICHDGALLDQTVMPRWLASFSDLAGIIVLRETPTRLRKRVRRELKRVGGWRFLDVLSFRAYYKLMLSKRDAEWEAAKARSLSARFPELPGEVPVLYTHSPNSAEAENFIRQASPDVMLARCKTLLKKSVFTIPRTGTFVLHPGICPEYRNAHGCFWALASGDVAKTGMTLLKIDEGVDTGPIFGYFTTDFDQIGESHIVIQSRVTYDNLDAIRDKLIEIQEGAAPRINVEGRHSATWGQPWLSAHLRWKWRARRKRGGHATSLLYHDVIPSGDFASSGFTMPGANRYKMTERDFADHLAALARTRSDAPSSVLDSMNRTATGDPWFLTFDDGGSSAYTAIAGMLEQYGWRGHFLVTTDYIGRPGFLTEAQVLEMQRRGHIIGSHSCSHPPRISDLGADALRREWRDSVKRLSDLLGEPVTVASVPGGFYSRAVAEAAAAAGIRYLFTSEPTTKVESVDGCRILGRFSLIDGDPPSKAAALAAGENFPRMKQSVTWTVKKFAKRFGGRAYAALRERVVD